MLQPKAFASLKRYKVAEVTIVACCPQGYDQWGDRGSCHSVKSLQRCSLITEDKERYKVTRVATMKSASDLKGYRPMTFYLWL
jgi:hypothetical protein